MSEQSQPCQNPDTRKKRDWKAINAERGLPEFSRYQWEQIQRVVRLTATLGKPWGYQHILEQLAQGNLPRLRKELEKEFRDSIASHPEYKGKHEEILWRDCYRKLDKLWACMLKAARDYGVAEEYAGHWVAEYLIENKQTGMRLRQNPDTTGGSR
jgi:hypothetical protein